MALWYISIISLNWVRQFVPGLAWVVDYANFSWEANNEPMEIKAQGELRRTRSSPFGNEGVATSFLKAE